MIENSKESFSGQVLEGLFGYRLGRNWPNINDTVRDFLDYESSQNRTPFVFITTGASLPAPSPIKGTADGAEEWVVHSTDADAANAILEQGCLYSHRQLREQGVEFRAFGRHVLGEPPDYFDLIQFSSLGGIGPELVVASKQHGRFCSESDSYDPGAPFYFRVASLQKQPSHIRFMGGHAVRGHLELKHGEYRTVSRAELPDTTSWTPRTFTEAADGLFRDNRKGV
ncbi:MAG: hypothetical protein JW889_09970 [Verrucomicrobia bacterium]|nr:hypothetical protein [Verrucomicrobiota bacterium]